MLKRLMLLRHPSLQESAERAQTVRWPPAHGQPAATSNDNAFREAPAVRRLPQDRRPMRTVNRNVQRFELGATFQRQDRTHFARALTFDMRGG